MQVHAIRQLRFKELLDNHEKYDFGIFIEMARKTLGLKRKEVCEVLDISQTHLFNLERGYYSILPALTDIIMLADYYGIDSQLLRDKSNYFFMQGKNSPRNRKLEAKAV